MQINMELKKVERKWSCHVRGCLSAIESVWALVWSSAAEKWCPWLCLALGKHRNPFFALQLCFVFLRKIAAAVGCAGLFCGHRLGVSGGERLAVVISPCLASGQAANCFSGLVPPGGICLQEKFPYSQVWAAELCLSQHHRFCLLRWINYVSSYGVGAGNICGCSEWKSCS